MKLFDPARDIVNQISTVNETIIFGGSLFTSSAEEPNIKKTVHWTSGSLSGTFYHAVFSANYSASATVELIDVTYGISVSSSMYPSASMANRDQINRVYRIFAKSLLGNENNRFSIDSVNRDELVFLAVKRSQFKDEIKKGSFSLVTTWTGSSGGSDVVDALSSASFNDDGAATTFTETNRGDTANILSGANIVGTLYYQAGIAALIPEYISITSSLATNIGNEWSGALGYKDVVRQGLEPILNGVRTRIHNVTFINQTNLHATFYFCRALNDEFNYSSNPTFTDSSGRIIPTSGSNNLTTRTYITKVGLLGENGETLATAALSKPIKKTPSIEYSLVVRLDY